MQARGLATRDILTDAAVRNAMAVHAAFGGSTNLLLHIPAIAHAAGLRRPTVDDWSEVNRSVPRLVDVLPNGPVGHPTVRVFLAGGVPEVMLHLRRARPARPRLPDRDRRAAGTRARLVGGLRASACACASGCTARTASTPTTSSWRRPRRARRGLTSTVTFPRGNLAPEGSVIKSTAIDPSVVDADGVYRKTGPARVFTRERDAIAAIKSQKPDRLKPGDVLVLICRGPLGAGMEEIYQITSALKHLSLGQAGGGADRRAVLRRVHRRLHRPRRPRGAGRRPDRRACATATRSRSSSTAIAWRAASTWSAKATRGSARRRAPACWRRGRRGPTSRPIRTSPADTRLWAALQQAGGGTWGGCVYDVDAITRALERGK